MKYFSQRQGVKTAVWQSQMRILTTQYLQKITILNKIRLTQTVSKLTQLVYKPTASL